MQTLKKYHRALFFLFLIGLSFPVSGQLSIDAASTDYTIDFDSTFPGVGNGTFLGTGFQPVPSSGRLDSDAWALEYDNPAATTPNWNYGFTAIAGQPAQGTSTGNEQDGGIYSFSGGAITGQSLGIVPSGSYFGNGYVKLKLVNNTGNIIQTVNLDYNLYDYNLEDRSSSVEVKLDYNGVIGDGNSFDYTHNISSLDYASPSTGDLIPTFIQHAMGQLITGLYIEPGDFFELIWTVEDISGSGKRDEFALDDIVVNVETLVGNPVFYSQGTLSPFNTIGFNFNSSREEWSTVPTGGVKYRCFPLLDSGTYVIQNGHTVRLLSSGVNHTIDNLIVESGGLLQGQYIGTSNSQRYLSLHGDIICDGQIGYANASINGAGIGFNFEPGSHTISGTGSFSASRLRKSNVNLLPGVCNLDILMNIKAHWLANSLYNDRQASDLGTNQFHVYIGPGVVFTAAGTVGIDNNNPVSNSAECGGSYTIDGVLNVASAFYATTDNLNIPVSTTIRNGGKLIARYMAADASGAAGHSFTMEDGSWLEIQGMSTGNITWDNFSTTNNVMSLLDGSTIEYSRAGGQLIPNIIEYRNLIVNTSGNKTVSPTLGVLRIHEDLTIADAAVLQPNSNDVHISGSWNNYDDVGFNESGISVTFDDASGISVLSCTGSAERFNHLIFNGGTVDLNTDIDVINDLDLFSRVNLNANNVLIRVPSSTSISEGFGYFTSEDIGHLGTVSVDVNTYAGPIDFPFGTDAGIPIYCRLNLNSGNAGIVTMATYKTGADNLPWPTSPIPVIELPSTQGYAPDNRTATADRFWSITSSNSTFDVDLSLALAMDEVTPNTNITAVGNLIGQRYDDLIDDWEPPLPGQVVLNPVFSNPNSILVTIPNVTQFSAWAVASTDSPLPVELLSFTGKSQENGILLEWTTYSEVHNSHFILDRFTEGNPAEFLAEILGNGNSSAESSYSHLDKAPEKGWNYYNLSQFDFDGSESDEGTLAVWWSPESEFDLVTYHWMDDVLHMTVNNTSSPYVIYLYDSAGKLLHRGEESEASVRIPVMNSANGMYILRLERDDVSLSRKIARFTF